MRSKRLTLALALSCLACMASVQAQEDAPGAQPKKSGYSPYPEVTYPNRVYFGDTHLHTTYSAYAGMIGNTLGREEAYRFAKGQMVKSSTGVQARLARPLDFLVVGDHAENLGLDPLLMARDAGLMATEFGKELGSFERVVEGEVVEEQEGIVFVADARRNGTEQAHARAFDGSLRFDNLGDSSKIVHVV